MKLINLSKEGMWYSLVMNKDNPVIKIINLAIKNGWTSTETSTFLACRRIYFRKNHETN